MFIITKHGEEVLRKAYEEAMEELQIENARIESTFLGMDDHGFLAQICLDYGGSGQCFQLWLGDMPVTIIKVLLSVIGVEDWEHLKGKYVRAEHNWSQITRVGNIITDDWLDPKKYYASKSVS